ncbi:tRNA pseudouridine(55) synthase TruB [Candidatus Peregrinibacteria bacterium]|nr:tRNA pseudouridine(55) synthase TruB [bacterium]NCQ55961.1 tRNA pseudouridine(55) synthase TruB [Candidatus Parcubacteria bacterium]NCS67986.1 tRNA pseudouridine(55) synthase TruB [Candidatus Peregrinibacteria bacterium]
MKPSQNFFLLVDKPAGFTSFDVCAKLRKPLGIKRIGHTGTLDPFATGLLVIAVGKCTKLIPLFEKDIKTYRTQILLGKTSETLDPESEIIDCHNGYVPCLEEIEKLLKEKFTGNITQIPPKYSALKIDGQRAYDLARKGEDVVMKERPTEVKAVKILNYNFPKLEVELTVAAGFYVRSFASDVGTTLCGGGLCSELRRTAVGAINLENSDLPVLNNFDDLNDDFKIDSQLLIKNIVHLEISPERLPDLQAGRAVFVNPHPANGEKVLVLCQGETVGLAEVKEGNLQPRVVF